MKPADPDMITATDVAALLGLNPKTVRSYAAQEVIPHRRVGRRMLFSRRAVTEWMHGKGGANGVER